MKMKTIMVMVVGAAMLVSAAFTQSAYPLEKKYPNKAIQILVPHAPGTGIDLFMRLVAEQLKNTWKVPVNIVNNTAAGGAIAAETVAHAAKDGSTMSGGLVSGLTTMSVANPGGTINLLRDFTPLAINYAYTGEMLMVRSDSEFKSLDEVIDYSRKNPNKLICSSGMAGTGTYLDVMLLKREAKMNIIHLPFSTMTEAVSSLLGGSSQLCVTSEAVAKTYVTGGKMRAIATLTSTRTASFPDVPTLIEKGYAQFNMVASILIAGPKDLPAEIIESWEKPLRALSKDPTFIAAANKIGVNVDLRMGTEKLKGMLKEDLDRYARFSREELGWAKQK